MTNAKEETAKRLELAVAFTENIKNVTEGVILVGSVAYAPDKSVTDQSDLDLVIVYEDVKTSIPTYFKRKKDQEALYSFDYDGYLAKQVIDGIPVSIHNISYKALEKIARADYENLAYYRQAPKDVFYSFKDFDSVEHKRCIRSEPIAGQMGVKRFDPVAFKADGKYVFGNDMDKLLSNSIILHQNDNKIGEQIDQLWINTAKRMTEHHDKFDKVLDVSKADITQYLCRADRFTPDVKTALKNRTMSALFQVA